jgi:hypothetical protein
VELKFSKGILESGKGAQQDYQQAELLQVSIITVPLAKGFNP